MIGIENDETPSIFRLTFQCRMKEEKIQLKLVIVHMNQNLIFDFFQKLIFKFNLPVNFFASFREL